MTRPVTPFTTNGSIRMRTDRTLIRAAAHSERYLLVDVTAPVVERDPSRSRPPVNIAFVLDRSGSMGGHGKLPLAKQAVLEAIERLDDRDRFSVVVYDDAIDVVVPVMEAGFHARQLARQRLAGVDSRGSTALHGGWLAGCEQVARGLASEGVNRVLLLTDGLANVGIREPAVLGAEAAKVRGRGITTSTLGVGRDFDEQLLTTMSDAGGGHFYFAGDVAQMRDHIASEVGDSLEVAVRNVVVELVLPRGAEVDALSPFRIERQGDRVRIHLGDMVSGQVISLALRLRFAVGQVGIQVDASASLLDQDNLLLPTLAGEAVATWTYADHEANDHQERDVEVTRFARRLDMERLKQESVGLNREGRYGEVNRRFMHLSQAMAQDAGDDAQLQAMASEAQVMAAQMAAPMPEALRKEVYFQSSNISRQRAADGRARKRAELDADEREERERREVEARRTAGGSGQAGNA